MAVNNPWLGELPCEVFQVSCNKDGIFRCQVPYSKDPPEPYCPECDRPMVLQWIGRALRPMEWTHCNPVFNAGTTFVPRKGKDSVAR